jgi:hypothetical protein
MSARVNGIEHNAECGGGALVLRACMAGVGASSAPLTLDARMHSGAVMNTNRTPELVVTSSGERFAGHCSEAMSATSTMRCSDVTTGEEGVAAA